MPAICTCGHADYEHAEEPPVDPQGFDDRGVRTWCYEKGCGCHEFTPRPETYTHPITGEPCGFNAAHSLPTDHIWAIYKERTAEPEITVLKRRDETT